MLVKTNYSASKAGIIGFTKSLAKEVGSRNILVNAVAPGFIQTQMTDVLKDEVKEEISKNIPLKRMGNTSDVANVVKFLASEDSSYITGQVINVDGGMLMWLKWKSVSYVVRSKVYNPHVLMYIPVYKLYFCLVIY